MTASPATNLPHGATRWQKQLISQAWLHSESVTRAEDEIDQQAMAIKGQVLNNAEHSDLHDAIFELKHAVADLVLNLYAATAARAQEIARTLPSREGPTRSVSIEDITDDAAFKNTMRDIFKEAGIEKDFG